MHTHYAALSPHRLVLCIENENETTIKVLLDNRSRENRSRRNNLRIIGIPEKYNAMDILRLCTKGIPEALGMYSPLPVDRAHRLGLFQQDRKTPRATIAAYLSYSDKTQLLQQFHKKQGLEVEGH